MSTSESAEREVWIKVQDDYKKSLAIARVCWGPNTPDDVLQSATATILIHRKDLVRAAQPHNQPSANSGADPAPDVCPKCQKSEMYDNRGDKKTARSPDFKCKDPECAHSIWLTPPPKKKGAAV